MRLNNLSLGVSRKREVTNSTTHNSQDSLLRDPPISEESLHQSSRSTQLCRSLSDDMPPLELGGSKTGSSSRPFSNLRFDDNK